MNARQIRDEAEYEIGNFDGSRVIKDKRIDKTGYPKVWLAKQPRSGARVCLKEFQDGLDSKISKEFVRDMKKVAGLEHSYIVKLIGFSASTPLMFQMEYMSKGSLFALLRSKESAGLDATRRTCIAMAMAHALMAIHELGIVHRSIKSGNVLFDERYVPHLGDCGFDREVDAKMMDRADNPPYWIAPEVLRGSNYGIEADIYSFGMLLYELLTDSVPWRGLSAKEMKAKVVDERDRPRMTKKGDDSMKDLIGVCWANKRQRRPTAEAIYRMFANHEVAFDGADSKTVDKMVDRISKGQEERTERRNTQRRDEPEYRRGENGGGYSERGGGSGQRREVSQFVDVEVLSDPRNYAFKGELRKAGTNLRRSQSRSFMMAVAEHFEDQQMRSSAMIEVLKALQKIVQQPCHFDMFVELKLHKSLPLDSDGDLLNATLDVLLVLFSKQPSLFEKGFKESMDGIIRVAPQKAATMLAYFAKDFGNMTHGWHMVDLILRRCKVFFKAHVGAEVVSIVFYLVENVPEYREARKAAVCEMLSTGLVCRDTRTVSLCYNGLAMLLSKPVDLDYGLVTEHLCDDAVCVDCLNFLIRIKGIPCIPELVIALLRCAETRVEATLILLGIAAADEGAGLLVRRPAWMLRGMPTVYDSLRLVLAVMTHRELLPVLARLRQTSEFLKSLCDESDDRIFTYVAAIIKRLPIDPGGLDKMRSNGVLSHIFRSAREFGDGPAMNGAVSIAHSLSRVGFAPEYLAVASYLKKVIAGGSTGLSRALGAALELSRHPLCAEKFNDIGLDRVVRKYRDDPNIGGRAREFSAAMSKAGFR